MIPSLVPTQLQNLTQVEEMLIARALPIMRVYINTLPTKRKTTFLTSITG